MSKLINKILKEAQKDDPFFQPKDLKSKAKEIKKQKREEKKRIEKLKVEISHKMKLGIKNIKYDYENKKWKTKKEELFLEIFSEFNLDIYYSKTHHTWILKDRNGEIMSTFNLEYNEFWVYDNVWIIFESGFRWEGDGATSFMKNMLKKYFKLNEFRIR